MGESPTNTIDVLVVDDTPSVRFILADHLREIVESSCVGVYECADGTEAYDIINDQSVVFLDLDMPNMDGFSVLRHLESNGIRPKGIAVISSRAGCAILGEALKSRVRSIYTEGVDFLPKPDPFTLETASKWFEDISAWVSYKVYGC